MCIVGYCQNVSFNSLCSCSRCSVAPSKSGHGTLTLLSRNGVAVHVSYEIVDSFNVRVTSSPFTPSAACSTAICVRGCRHTLDDVTFTSRTYRYSLLELINVGTNISTPGNEVCNCSATSCDEHAGHVTRTHTDDSAGTSTGSGPATSCDEHGWLVTRTHTDDSAGTSTGSGLATSCDEHAGLVTRTHTYDSAGTSTGSGPATSCDEHAGLVTRTHTHDSAGSLLVLGQDLLLVVTSMLGS